MGGTLVYVPLFGGLHMSQLTSSDFTAYPASTSADDAITAGPNALYAVSLDQILPTQMNEGFTEVGKKAAGFDLLTSQAELTANLLTDIEPVVIGPDGTLYLLDGHHTFTALADSVWGASDPTVYVDVVANYSNLSESQFFATLQSNNLLLPLNDGVPQIVDDANGNPIPTSLLDLTSDPYRGLEYSILKNKSSKLFTTTNNITGAIGAATPGLDKMTGFYSDFLEAAAYRDANNGKGLPYLSPGDIALATQWNLTATNLTTLPNVSGTVEVGQLPGYILNNGGAAANIIITGIVSNSTLANGALDGTKTGTFDETTTFASFNGITEINAGTVANPIIIGTPNVGFIMQLGADDGGTVTLSNAANTYTGGTSLLAGTLIVAGDGSLGAAPEGATPTESNFDFTASLTFAASGVPNNVKSAVQADNGIIFNGLTEGNPILQIGTTSGGGTATFATSRPIAVGGEVATLNLNDYIVTLNGQLISLGVDGDGVGNATGFSDITFDDLSSAGTGKVILSTASPYFYGNVIIGNTGTPIVEVMSDAALGNTTGSADMIGQVELNGGTLQTGASFAAPERNLFLGGGSSFDVDGNTTSWGTITDVQRTLEILNSNTSTAGAVTFNNLTISATAILQLAGGAAGETVTLTNGIVRSGADTLIIQPSSTTSLGTTEKVLSGIGAASLVNTIAPVWIVENNDASKGAGPYDFVTYGANGYVKATYDSTATLNSSTGADVVALSGNATLSGNASVYALNTEGKTVTLGSNTLTIGDGTTTDAAGLILATGSAISGGTLAFGQSEGVIWLSGTNPTISSEITGTGGLTFSGSGTVAISTAANVEGTITIDSGTVNLAAMNVFANDTAGVLLDNTKSKPSAANLTISSNNQFTSLNSVGNNSTITIKNGSVLTIGDSNNQSSTISSAITDTTLTAGAITTAGTGLVDLSGATVTLAAGSSIFATGGQLRVATGALKNTAVAGSAPNFVLSNNADLQFAQSGGGQYAGAISGDGTLHLIGGTLQLIGTGNTYTGGTIVETGSTLDITTANLPTINENITDAGGLIVFDQDSSGNFTGVISDGQEMGTGPTMSGSLDIDDSAATNASKADVFLLADQTYTGATYVEAGTLTLNVTNAIVDSSGLTLGRVGGAIDGQTANLVLDADNQLTALSDDASNTTSVVLNGHVLTLDPTTTSVSAYGGTIEDGTTHGSIVVDGTGTVTLEGNNTFSGGITVDAGTLELGNSNAAGTGTITFSNNPTDPTLKIDHEVRPTNTISGFDSSDAFDLVGFDASTTSANMDYNTDVLTVADGNGNSITLNLTGDYTGEFFHAAASSDGADITENNVACYCMGTLIHTERGQTRVENLKIGDKVKTMSGVARPIKWIGRRSYSGRFVLGRTDILPICIRAGALGDSVPNRDLWISPHHAMYLQGVLIEAKDLVNSVSIFQAAHVEEVQYFHIELDSHDVIIANGALSETFIDDDSRCMFHNAHEYVAMYPDAVDGLATRAQYCAPRYHDGYEVEAARRHVASRAGLRPALPKLGELRGYIDHVGAKRIRGWAQTMDHPEVPVCLDIYAGGRLIGHILANEYRSDLERAGLGSGCHSFEFTPPAGLVLAPDAVEVRRSFDGAILRRSLSSRRAA